MFVSLTYAFLPLALYAAFRRNILLLIPFLIIAYILGFLREYGADYNSYVQLINESRSKSDYTLFNDDIEVQWRLIFSLLSSNFSNEAIFGIIFVASVTLRVVAYRSYFENKDYALLALGIYFVTDFISRDFGQIRNAMGASLLCLSFMLYQKKGYRWTIFVLPVFGHISYVLFLLPLIIYEKVSPRQRYIVLLIGLGLGYFLLRHLSTQLVGRGEAGLYFKLIAYASGYKHISGIYPITLPVTLLVVLWSFHLRHKADVFSIYVWIFTIAIGAFFVFREFPVISSRIFSIYTPILGFAIGDILSHGVKTVQLRSIFYFIIVTGLLIIYFVRIHSFHMLYG